MQQEIKLSKGGSNTVFVDDVAPANGIYYIHDKCIYYIVGENGKFRIQKADNYNTNCFFALNLKELIKNINIGDGIEVFTLDNKRIVTEREVTIDDLKNTDHVGFVDDNGDKGHIVCIEGQLYFTAVTNKSDTSYGYAEENKFRNVKEALSIGDICGRVLKQIIRFTTRKELYQWLAE